ETDVVLSVVDDILDQFAAGAVAARAGLAEGVPPEQLAARAEQAVGDGPAYSSSPGRPPASSSTKERRWSPGKPACPAVHRQLRCHRTAARAARPARWPGCGRCRCRAGTSS